MTGGRKTPSERRESQIVFLGDQAGEPEASLKTALSASFRRMPGVQRAYLARVAMGDRKEQGVALCVALTRPRGVGGAIRRTFGELLGLDPSKAAVLAAAGEIFRDTFATDQHLDILFLEGLTPESDVASVCAPFYRAE